MFLFCLSLCCFYLYASENKRVPQQMVIQMQEIIENKETSLKKAVKNLECYDPKMFEEEYLKLPIRAKLIYLTQLNIEQYEYFLNRFGSEQEWQKFWQRAPEEERKRVPSWTQQLALVRDCYYTFYRKQLWFASFFCSDRADIKSDIARYKKYFQEYDTYNAYLNHDNKILVLYQMFQRRKLRLLRTP